MPNNTDNVAVGKGDEAGYIFSAPYGTKLPADQLEPLDAAFVGLGYIGEDGVTNSIESNPSDFNDMNGEPICSAEGAQGETLAFALAETSLAACKEAYGQDAVDGTEEKFVVKHTSAAKPIRSYVIEILLGETRKKRIVAPKGKVSSIDDVTYNFGQLVSYPLTVKCLHDASVGARVVEYIGPASAAPAPANLPEAGA